MLPMTLHTGLTKKRALHVVNALIRPFTKGLFHDETWKPVQEIRLQLEQAGVEFIPVEGSGKYEHENGVAVRKTWLYEIPFTNQNGRPDKVHLRIVASGAGPVADPLSVYDVVAYAS